MPGIKMVFCWVPATTSEAWKQLSGGKDTFTMGSPENEANRRDDESQHEVRLTKGFWMGKYEVTQTQWQRVMGSNPSEYKGGDKPVINLDWDDCSDFIRRIGASFRLPTEAEWEFACRAGRIGEFSGEPDHMGWIGAGSGPHPVGGKDPNRWGLHDMHGNVYEWCADWYGKYPATLVSDPIGPQTGSGPTSPRYNANGLQQWGHVVRGGSWGSKVHECRSASRLSIWPGYGHLTGFRIAMGDPSIDISSVDVDTEKNQTRIRENRVAEAIKTRMQTSACQDILRTIQAAKDQYAIDHNDKVPDSLDDLMPTYFQMYPNRKYPACPGRGKYTVNSRRKLPECSIPGHVIVD